MKLSQDLSDPSYPTFLLTFSSQDIDSLERESVLKDTLDTRDQLMNLFVRLSPMSFISFTSRNQIISQAPYDVYLQEFPDKPSLLSLVFSRAGLETLLGNRSLCLEFETDNGYRDLVVNYLPYAQ